MILVRLYFLIIPAWLIHLLKKQPALPAASVYQEFFFDSFFLSRSCTYTISQMISESPPSNMATTHIDESIFFKFNK
jgi:hypothetical protein